VVFLDVQVDLTVESPFLLFVVLAAHVNESLDIAEDWGGNCSFTSGLPLFLGWLSFVSTGGIHSPVLLFEDLAFS